tara:strand:+ start:1433 stop:1567 length:135 start_codon:yes stop_codon:yes gene_type:complete
VIGIKSSSLEDNVICKINEPSRAEKDNFTAREKPEKIEFKNKKS